MGIRNWRDALSERLGKLDISNLATAQAIEDLQTIIAKAETTDGKTDINSVPDPSSKWSDRAHENPSLGEIGASREGTSASGRAAPELIRRFSDLSPGDQNTELYSQLGEMLKSASVLAKMLEKMDRKDLRKSTHLSGVVKNLIQGLREVAKALGDDAEDDDEMDEGDARRDGDMEATEEALSQFLKSKDIPTYRIDEALAIVSGRKSVVGTPPDFGAIRKAADEVSNAQTLLDSGELSSEQSARLQTAITRVQAARAGAVVPSAALAAAITVLQNPYDMDVRMVHGGNV